MRILRVRTVPVRSITPSKYFSMMSAITRKIAAGLRAVRIRLDRPRQHELRIEGRLEDVHSAIDQVRQESASLTGHMANVVNTASFELNNRITHVETELRSRIAELAANQQNTLEQVSAVLASMAILYRHTRPEIASVETRNHIDDAPDPSAHPGQRALWRLENIEAADGRCFKVQLPPEAPRGDSMERGTSAATMLLENGIPLGPPHSQHDAITEFGGGRYSYWEDTVYFSTSDGTDPRFNGRTYHLIMSSLMTGAEWRRQVAKAFDELPDDYSKPKAYEAVERALKIVYPEAILGDYGKLYWNETDLIREYEPLAKGNIRPFERKFAVFNLIRLLDDVAGEFAECGAYNGGTAYFMAKAAAQSGQARIIHLFDSFEGLSNPSAADGDHWFENALAVSEDEARANLKGFSDVHFYKGWIPERFNEIADRTFAFVHIDVDIYQPTRDSIEFFYPRLAPGGILLCDDYGFTQCPGATKAMDEFFAGKPERIVHLPTAQALIIKR